MEVVLRRDIPKLGKAGDVVKVKDGFARNYLIPKGLAILANQKTIQALERERKVILAKAEKEKKKALGLAEKLQGQSLTLYRKVVEEGRLYGSVSAVDIAKALLEQGLEIDKKQVLLEEPLKTVGSFEVMIKVSPEISVPIRVEIIEEK
ncbi:50S ribosomal protein L9 [Caldimicrobium thiodismutans]|uniref:Large ribosomal subunit protein bL9 n=1 Tax=Caldimicrobium thiodismutans TaxID=1653476 RepID=A0A0U4W2F6_9BACT|nr:50S ribosomal protein L9 [Caldimicrobium thiodismutans]BAU23259.1 50S ribosomal protein L9 [Caldimicrobium thiodismutans]